MNPIVSTVLAWERKLDAGRRATQHQGLEGGGAGSSRASSWNRLRTPARPCAREELLEASERG